MIRFAKLLAVVLVVAIIGKAVAAVVAALDDTRESPYRSLPGLGSRPRCLRSRLCDCIHLQGDRSLRQ